MSEGKPVAIRVSMPEDVRARFKAKCALEGVSMNDQVVKLIEQWVQPQQQSKQG
jgi:ParG